MPAVAHSAGKVVMFAAMLSHEAGQQLRKLVGTSQHVTVRCALDGINEQLSAAHGSWLELLAIDWRRLHPHSPRSALSLPHTPPLLDTELEAAAVRLKRQAYGVVWEFMKPHLHRMLNQFTSSALPPSVGQGGVATSGDVGELADVRVVVIVFFGRKRTFKILHLYLLANLRAHGGLIDEVVLITNTENKQDLAYQRELLERYPWYRESSVGAGLDLKWEHALAMYGHFYTEVAEARAPTGAGEEAEVGAGGRGAAQTTTSSQTEAPTRSVYLKIDDDIVYIADGAIEALVRAKLALHLGSEPSDGSPPAARPLFVSANVVNHPRLSHVHQAQGLIRYFDIVPSRGSQGSYSARQVVRNGAREEEECRFSDDPFGRTELGSWRCAAMIHESFLADLEAGDSQKWASFGARPVSSAGANADTTEAAATAVHAFHTPQVSNFTRWSINAFALEPRDLAAVNTSSLAAQLLQDDERFLSSTYPAHLGRPCVALGAAVMVHYSYRLQSRGWCEEHDAAAVAGSAAGAEASDDASGGGRASPRAAEQGDSERTCTMQDAGGLDDHVGGALLERYHAHAMAQHATLLFEDEPEP